MAQGTNWEEGTRVPLILVAPGFAEAGLACDEPVSLVDPVSTLLELCGLPAYDQLDGQSLVRQLRDPSSPMQRPAYTINGGRHQSVRSKRWRYIRYEDGSEELYDHQADPTEYRNLASDPKHSELKRELAGAFPEEIRRVNSTTAVRFGPDGEPTDLPEESGFRPIFNGYDLTSWEGDPSLWRVENGAIVGETRADNALPHNKFLIWRGSQPGNFELRLQFRVIGENNSGVQYRSQERPDLGEWAMSGYQADMHPAIENLGWSTRKRDERSWPGGASRSSSLPQGRKMLVETLPSIPKVNDGPEDLSTWRDMTIIAEGNHLIHKIDGETIADVRDYDAARRARKGLIGLQLHRGAKDASRVS